MINAATQTSGLQGNPNPAENPKGVLGKDDFMMLLLAQLQYQDPTEPTDTATILTQTSQLAGLESTENTNKALEELSASLSSANQFGTIAAIGKIADLGSNAISLDKGDTSTFEVYFPSDIKAGSVEILDVDGKVVSTIDIEENLAGTHQFNWDGLTSGGQEAEEGVYYVTASYSDPDGNALETRLGSYPIESVRFDGTNTMVKVGSTYVPLENVSEIR